MVAVRIIGLMITSLILGHYTTSKAAEGISFPLHTLLSAVDVDASSSDTKVSALEATVRDKTVEGIAFWQSFLVPGLGQIATGRRTVGYGFIAAEAGLIGGIVGLRMYAGRLENNYRSYAAQHAGVSPDQEHQYYVDLGNWMDTRSYNEARLRDRSFDALYTDPGDQWQWDSDDSRGRFKTMRIDSDGARGNALLLVGGLVLNHLFSAIEAARGASSHHQITYAPLDEGGGTVTLAFHLP